MSNCEARRFSFHEFSQAEPRRDTDSTGDRTVRRLIGAALAVAGMAAAGIALAEDFTPAIVFDMGGKLDAWHCQRKLA